MRVRVWCEGMLQRYVVYQLYINLASFPGSPHARTKITLSRFSVLEAMERWAGPGNEPNINQNISITPSI